MMGWVRLKFVYYRKLAYSVVLRWHVSRGDAAQNGQQRSLKKIHPHIVGLISPTDRNYPWNNYCGIKDDITFWQKLTNWSQPVKLKHFHIFFTSRLHAVMTYTKNVIQYSALSLTRGKFRYPSEDWKSTLLITSLKIPKLIYFAIHFRLYFRKTNWNAKLEYCLKAFIFPINLTTFLGHVWIAGDKRSHKTFSRCSISKSVNELIKFTEILYYFLYLSYKFKLSRFSSSIIFIFFLDLIINWHRELIKKRVIFNQNITRIAHPNTGPHPSRSFFSTLNN